MLNLTSLHPILMKLGSLGSYLFCTNLARNVSHTAQNLQHRCKNKRCNIVIMLQHCDYNFCAVESRCASPSEILIIKVDLLENSFLEGIKWNSLLRTDATITFLGDFTPKNWVLFPEIEYLTIIIAFSRNKYADHCAFER